MLNQDCLISLVIPVFNEEANLHQLIERCLSVCRGLENPFEIILVDDGSQDQSAKLIEYAALANPELKGVFLNRNYGQHAAVTAGFETSKGEIIITLDANPPADSSHPPGV
jgi:undecaprenyl-phosphate 4-deoxy-4-formamido-L-arabinose transferase